MYKRQTQGGVCPNEWDSATTDLSAFAERVVIGVDGTPFSFVEVLVDYDPAQDADGSPAALVISNNADGSTQKEVQFTTLAGDALIAVYPQEVDFKSVQAEESKEEEVLVVNDGTSDLIISRIDFQGPSVFSLIIDETEYPIGVIDYSAACLLYTSPSPRD